MVAASRNAAAARLDERRVREESTLPPDILLPGERHSHEVKCLAEGQREPSRVFVEAVWFESGGLQDLTIVLLPVVCLSFCRWDVADGFEQAAMVEAIDPVDIRGERQQPA